MLTRFPLNQLGMIIGIWVVGKKVIKFCRPAATKLRPVGLKVICGLVRRLMQCALDMATERLPTKPIRRAMFSLVSVDHTYLYRIRRANTARNRSDRLERELIC